MLKKINNYLSLVRFSHTVFALPFAFIGFFLAVRIENKEPSVILGLLVLLCMIFARNTAMAFNRYTDRHIDKKNQRTSQREIPARIITPRSALLFVILNAMLFVATTYFINLLCFYLSPLALFIIMSYSYTKRFTYLCHLILGIGLALAPIGSFIAVTGYFRPLPLLFSFAVLFWVSGFDIIYSLQDVDFDKTNRLKSIPVKIGIKNALILSSIMHLITSLLLILPLFFWDFGFFYWIGFIFFIFILIYQHFIISSKNLSRLNVAFFSANGIASVLFAVFVILDVYVKF